jgi:hypothetical protein
MLTFCSADAILDAPPDNEVDGMAEMALAVVKLIEDLHRACLGPGEPLPPFPEEEAIGVPEGKTRKRTWEDMTVGSYCYYASTWLTEFASGNRARNSKRSRYGSYPREEDGSNRSTSQLSKPATATGQV